MGRFDIKLGKTRIIFFDLEFYVPDRHRGKPGFCYNPWKEDCKFLGGKFLVTNPKNDFLISSQKINEKMKSFWLWEYDSEKALLEEIYQLLKLTSDYVKAAHHGSISAILCGIGITSSDIPILFELFKKYKILNNENAFYFQNDFRVVDISLLAIPTFNNKTNLMYPKSKNIIFNKYLSDSHFDTGKKVWDLYESKEYKKINQRTSDEVISTYKCYMKILEDFQKFKKLEKNDKRQQKLIEKFGENHHG